MEQKRCISSLTLAELTDELKALGQPGFRAKQIFHWVHQKLVTEFSAMTDQPKTLLAKLEETFYIAAPQIERRAVLHSFSGSAEAARQLASDGRCISFSGTVTYKNARNIHEAAAVVPDDLILCETDAPYLPPVPHRGKINSSAYLPHTISAIAEIRATSPEAVAELTMNNAVRLFGFDR